MTIPTTSITTLDQLIQDLQDVADRVGGSTPVLIEETTLGGSGLASINRDIDFDDGLGTDTVFLTTNQHFASDAEASDALFDHGQRDEI